VADHDSDAPPPSSQTIQVDALSDVELLDQGAEPGEPPNVSSPPPLPRKPKGASSARRAVELLAVVIVTGALGAVGAHFVAPSAPAPAPPPPAAAPPPVIEPEINHVILDEGLVIRAEPDAGLAAPE
jgi:hypothetical protein